MPTEQEMTAFKEASRGVVALITGHLRGRTAQNLSDYGEYGAKTLNLLIQYCKQRNISMALPIDNRSGFSIVASEIEDGWQEVSPHLITDFPDYKENGQFDPTLKGINEAALYWVVCHVLNPMIARDKDGFMRAEQLVKAFG